MRIEVPISVSELFDKITILEIKVEKGLVAAQKELDELNKKVPADISQRVMDAVVILKTINISCWNVEEEKRKYEETKTFDDTFVELARCVYLFNDERSRVKKIIDKLTNSEITEHKSHRTN